MDLEHEKRLADVENKAKSNTRRIENLEGATSALTDLATAVQVMATKQDGMVKSINRLDASVEAIKEKPGKRAEAITEKILLVIVSALVGAALAHFGL